MKILIFVKQRSAAQRIMSDFTEAFIQAGHPAEYVDLFVFLEKYKNSSNKEKVLKNFLSGLKDFNADFILSYGREIFEIEFPLDENDLNNTISLAEILNKPVILLFFDDPLNAPFGERSLEPHRFIQSPMCMLYCWDMSFFPELKEKGFENVNYLPMSVNINNFFPETESIKDIDLNNSVTFVGGPSTNRIDILKQIETENIDIFGYQEEEWTKNGKLKPFFRYPVTSGTELRKIYSNSKINLNITLPHGKTSINMRVFEVLACKGFLITDYKEDIDRLFKIDSDLIVFRNIEELNRKIKYFISNENDRLKIAESGYDKVVKNHTYIHRVNTILNDCKEFIPLSKKYLDAKSYYYKKEYNKSIVKSMELLEHDSKYIRKKYIYFLIAANYKEKKNFAAADEYFKLSGMVTGNGSDNLQKSKIIF